MADEDEVLEAGRGVSHWVRRTALITGLILVAALLVRLWLRGEDTKSPGAAAAPTAPITGTVSAATSSGWPTATAGCGGQTKLPIVSSSRRAARHTGLALLVGGAALHVVDFDSSKYDDVVVHWHHSLFVTVLVPGYAVVHACGGADEPAISVQRISSNGTAPRPIAVRVPVPVHTLLADGSRAWGVALPRDKDHAGLLVPIGDGQPRRMPIGFWPIGITGGRIVGKLPGTGNGPASVVLLDLTTGRIRANLGPGSALAVGHGVVVWSENCSMDRGRRCEVHRRPVGGGATSSYRIPRPPGISGGTLSPDGRQLAFTIQRREPHPGAEQDQPTDIAVLHLDNGVLELVPGVELPAKTSPALAFSADGQWLAIALDTGMDIRLLAWRTGLALPIESTSVAGPVQGAPALQVLPHR